MHYQIILTYVSVCWAIASGSFDPREQVAAALEKAGMQNVLSAGVRAVVPKDGPIEIYDDGQYLIQHTVLNPDSAAEPNIIIDYKGEIRSSAEKLVIVTHGWLDKGEGRWPSEMANEIYKRADPNEWVCGSYDWSGGSVVISSIFAAEYGRDIAGPRLAAAIIKFNHKWKHIHLIGHSAGSWTIQSAAKKLSQAYPEAMFHLTFLDAYVPGGWSSGELGRIFENGKTQHAQCWADHYFTRDITYKVTQQQLQWAHNVDISGLDPFICEHEFPYRWYMATITGSYYRWDERKYPVYCSFDCIDYGFWRSLESGQQNWSRSLELGPDNIAIIIKEPKSK